MKFAIFGYDFPHWKTERGLLNLAIGGFKPSAVFLQGFKELGQWSPWMKSTPHYRNLNEPANVCIALGLKTFQVDHDNEEVVSMIRAEGFDFGIVLGARILQKQTIEAFKYGVINVHPGILPENRGLDNMKWAINKGLKQGITIHWINEYVDRGALLIAKSVPVYVDDNLVTLHQRIQEIELYELVKLLQEFAQKGIKEPKDCTQLGKGELHSLMPRAEELSLPLTFAKYKQEVAVRDYF